MLSSLEGNKISKSFEESLKFITSNLGNDRRTVKLVNKISKDTNLSYYRIRKYLSDLMDRGLIINKKQRLILVDNELICEIFIDSIDNDAFFYFR